MLLGVGGGSQVVVQVHKDTGLVSKGVVHQPLEGLGGVLEAKRHVEVLEQAEGGDDGCLRDSGSGDWHLVVALDQVQLAEDLASGQAAVEVLHVGQGIPVRGSDVVESAVVAAGSPAAILFRYHVQWRRPGAVRPSDNTCSFKLGKLLLCHPELVRVQVARLGKN